MRGRMQRERVSQRGALRPCTMRCAERVCDVLALNDNNTNTYNTDVSGISGITQAQLMLFSAHENGDDRIIYRSVSAPVGVDP